MYVLEKNYHILEYLLEKSNEIFCFTNFLNFL